MLSNMRALSQKQNFLRTFKVSVLQPPDKLINVVNEMIGIIERFCPAVEMNSESESIRLLTSELGESDSSSLELPQGNDTPAGSQVINTFSIPCTVANYRTWAPR